MGPVVLRKVIGRTETVVFSYVTKGTVLKNRCGKTGAEVFAGNKGQ